MEFKIGDEVEIVSTQDTFNESKNEPAVVAMIGQKSKVIHVDDGSAFVTIDSNNYRWHRNDLHLISLLPAVAEKPLPQVGQIWRNRRNDRRVLACAKTWGALGEIGITINCWAFEPDGKLYPNQEHSLDLITFEGWAPGYGPSAPPIAHKAACVPEMPKSEPQHFGRDSDGLTPTDRRLRDERVKRTVPPIDSLWTDGDIRQWHADRSFNVDRPMDLLRMDVRIWMQKKGAE